MRSPESDIATPHRTGVDTAASNDRHGWRAAMIAAIIATIPASIFLAARHAFLPLWDGHQYWECLMDAARASLNPVSFNCFGHPTMAYFWILGLAQRLAPAAYWPVLTCNLVLLLISSLAFHEIARMVLPGQRRGLEAVLLTSCWAANPVVLAAALQLTPDFGVAVFTILFTWALLRKRRVLAMMFGTAAMLSKEPGVFLYAAAVTCFILAFITRSSDSLAVKRRALRQASLLYLPVVCGAVGLFAILRSAGSGALWQGLTNAEPLWRQMLTVSMLDNRFVAALGTIFVLNFMWVPSLVSGVHATRVACRSLINWAFRTESPARADYDEAWSFLVMFTLSAVFLLTRFRTFINARYYLVLIPLLLLVSARCAHGLKFPSRTRHALFTAVVVLFLLSAVRTVDPVSMILFKTFSVGDRIELAMTSMTGECCGQGRDQLVYNLQFAEFNDLVNAALMQLHAQGGQALAMHRWSDWYLVRYVNRRTGQRSGPSADAELVRPRTREDLDKGARPERVSYLEMPNMAEAEELDEWRRFYSVGEPTVIRHNGYEIATRELRLRH
jgi:hypothetical protein